MFASLHDDDDDENELKEKFLWCWMMKLVNGPLKIVIPSTPFAQEVKIVF